MREHKPRNPYNHYEGWTNVFIMHRPSRRRNQSALVVGEGLNRSGVNQPYFEDSTHRRVLCLIHDQPGLIHRGSFTARQPP